MANTKFKITTDSAVDLSDKTLAKNNIEIARLNLMIDGKSHQDRAIPVSEIVRLLNEGHIIQTSTPTPNEYNDLWGRLLDDYEHIFHFSMSSAKSSSFQLASMLANDELIHPNRITVIDSKHLAAGLGQVVLKAAGALEETNKIEELIQKFNSLIERTEMVGVLSTVKHAKEGGRLVKVMGASDRIGLIKKAYLVQMEDGRLRNIGLGIGSAEKRAQKLFDKALEDKIENDFVVMGTNKPLHSLNPIITGMTNLSEVFHVEKSEIGTAVSAHSGPGTFALAYTRKKY